MALCSKCTFMNKQYDEFRQDYNDAIVVGNTTVEHFCPMYDDHIPNGIYYKGEKCEYYMEKQTD